MQLGMVGLGRMGANIVRRLMRDGHECVVFDVNPESVAAARGRGRHRRQQPWRTSSPSSSKPRAVWVMIPAGITGQIVDQFAALLEEGDIIIDGGNSNYRDDVRRAAKLQGAGHPLRRRRHQRRRVRPGARLLPDGRRPDEAVVATIDPVLKTHRARGRRDRADARPQRRSGARGAGLPALRTVRRRALREDGPQRHRVRHHGRLRRGPEHPRQRRCRHPGSRALRRDRAAGGAGVLPVRHRHREGRRAVAPRVGRLLLAAGPDRGRAAGEPDAGRSRRAGCRTPARVAGRSRPPSTSAFRLPCSPPSLFERFASRDEDHFANQVLSAMRQQFGGHQELPAGDSLEAGGEKADQGRSRPTTER